MRAATMLGLSLVSGLATASEGLHKDLNSCAYWLTHLNDVAVWEDLIKRIRARDGGDFDEDIWTLKDNIRRARQNVIDDGRRLDE